jgi:hypothetical protein
MFEEEAEKIMMQKVIKKNDCIMTPCKTLEDCQLYDFCFDDMVNAFKDGAEYGYNKCFEQIKNLVDEHTRLDCIIPELLRLHKKED